MGYRRIYVRVPLTGNALLSAAGNPVIKARTIDISQGGVGITGLSNQLSPNEYRIEVETDTAEKIEIIARLVRMDDSTAGFQTLQIDPESHQVIKKLVADYQNTIDFIHQVDEYGIMEVVDEEGNEIEITFENNPNDEI